MINTDAKQERLRELFAELRRLKQEDLQFWYPDDFVTAYRQKQVREKIREIEQKIERVLNDAD